MVFHCFGIPLGQGKPINYYAKCRNCSFERQANSGRYLKVDSDATDLEEIIAKTYPDIRSVYHARLSLEQTVRRHPASLSRAERTNLLMEPFRLINPTVEKHFSGQTPLDLESSIGCLGTIFLTIGVFVLAVIYRRTSLGDRLLLITLFVGFFCTAVTLYQFYRRPFRYFRRHLMPLLVKSLKPLNPSNDELEQCVLQCKGESLLVGKRIDVKWLSKSLQLRSGD
jgi:hypothetical protein